MKSLSTYYAYLKDKGRPLSEINPGSDEIALTADDALFALDMLKNDQAVILGGDILSEDDDQLIYAYQLWGHEYHELNWFFTVNHDDSTDINSRRSHALALESIINARKVAGIIGKKCYVVFVISF